MKMAVVDYTLPDELWTEVLSRVPVKTLMGCIRVCKSWHAFLTSHNFLDAQFGKLTCSPPNAMSIMRHHNSRGYQEPGRLSAKRLREVRYTLHPDDEDFVSGYQEIDLPFQGRADPYFMVVGSCNGVIALWDDDDDHRDNFIFWNPCIRKALYVPDHGFSNSATLPHLGFGFDQRTNDFKLARVCSIKDDSVPSELLAKVELFSLREGRWKLTNSTHPWHDFELINQCFLNGCIHWLFYSDEAGDAHFLIVTFNFASETFGEIFLPEGGDSHVEDNASIMVYKGMLALVRDFDDHPTIWAMVEYGAADSWSKLVRFEHLDSCAAIFGFRSNGEILYLDQVDEDDDSDDYDSPHDEYGNSEELSMLFAYQPASGVTKRFGKMYGDPSTFELISYVPTLALLKEGETITERIGRRHGQLLNKVNTKIIMFQKVEEGRE